MSDPALNPPTATTSSGKRKPRVSLAIATAFGLGYIPKAPGTFGSLGGLALSIAILWLGVPRYWDINLLRGGVNFWTAGWGPSTADYAVTLAIAVLGVYVADQASKFSGTKDPQFVVIDEVAGQLITLIGAPLTWQSLLTGLILFRAFDIVKPPPVRQLERLPEGTGIVIDDVGAGLYGLIIMHLLRHFGLLMK